MCYFHDYYKASYHSNRNISAKISRDTFIQKYALQHSKEG